MSDLNIRYDLTSLRQENGLYLVMVYLIIQVAPSLHVNDYGRWRPVAAFPIQSDAIEVRDMIKRGEMNENRLKLLINNYDGRPKRIVKWQHGEPVFHRV